MVDLFRKSLKRGENVRAVPASARIYAALREQILAMEVIPGTALQEKQIAFTYGVSRTPVREALLKLGDERLVEIFPQYGTFVSRISLPEVRDAMLIRQALERAAVRQAAERIDAAGEAELNTILAHQRATHEAGRLGDFYTADEIFHQAISEIAGHPNLWRVIRQEKAQVDRCRILTLPAAERRASVIREHEVVMAALVKHDPDAAEAAMHAHLGRVLPSVEALVAAHPSYFYAEAGATGEDRAAPVQALSPVPPGLGRDSGAPSLSDEDMRTR